MQFTLIPVLFAAAVYAGCNTSPYKQDGSDPATNGWSICTTAKPYYVFVSRISSLILNPHWMEN